MQGLIVFFGYIMPWLIAIAINLTGASITLGAVLIVLSLGVALVAHLVGE